MGKTIFSCWNGPRRVDNVSHLPYTLNIMTSTDLATQNARASAAIVLIQFSGIIPGSVPMITSLNIFRVNGPMCVTGEFPSQRPVTGSFDIFFDLRLNKRLSKQSRRGWFETPSTSLQFYADIDALLYNEVCPTPSSLKSTYFVRLASIHHLGIELPDWHRTAVTQLVAGISHFMRRLDMEARTALMALCDGNRSVTGVFVYPHKG